MSLWNALLDRSIVFSFDAHGYRRHARGFGASDLPEDLSAKVVVVTGANAGIGRATATELATRGATVHLLCRNDDRGEEAQASIRATAGHGRVFFSRLDVTDLEAVKRVALELSLPRIDALVHNAGLLPAERTLSRQGHEITWAAHILGPLALTMGLLGPLEAAGGRVIFVSSGGMYTQRLDLRDHEWSARKYDGVVAYAQTKRMQVELTGILANALEPRGISVHVMHPGWADTRSVRKSLPGFHRMTRRILRTAEEGADTVVYLAAARHLAPSTGGFWFDREAVSTHLRPGTQARPGDPEALMRLAARDAGLDIELL